MLIAAFSLMCLAFGGAVLLVVNYVRDTIVSGLLEKYPLFLYHFGELWCVFPLMLAAVSLMVHFASIRSRNGRSFDVYSDHFRVAFSQMRPEPEQRPRFRTGGMLIPWSAVESYSWKPDHLELTVRPGPPHNRISERWRVFGVVPPEQRETAHAFLSARMPGDGQPSGS